MNTKEIQDIRLLYGAVYDEELREMATEYNNIITDEDIVEVATEYFYTYGLNDVGVDILIEKVGLDNFVEFVYGLSEDFVISEAKPKYKSHLARQREAQRSAKAAAQERTETERKEPESRGADTQAKAEQPKKKPIRDAIARQVLSGMERHRKATETAGRLAKETGKTLGRIAAVAGEAGRRAGEHVKTHGLKSLAHEEFEEDIFDYILEHLISEGYADTNENALKIMANMSEEWRDDILEKADNTIRLVYGKGGKGVPIKDGSGNVLREPNVGFAQQGRDFRNATADAAERASWAAGERGIRNRRNAARLQKAHKKSIKQLNAKSGDGDYDAPEGHNYDTKRSDRAARRRRETGR